MILFALLSVFAAPAAHSLDLTVPGAEEILAEGKPLDCRYVSDDTFGFQFTRLNENDVKVELITNNKVEPESSSFVAIIKNRAVIGYHLYFFKREGRFGTYREFELRNERKSYLGNRFAGLAMQVSALYQTQPDGSEKETLYPDFSKTMACSKEELP